MPYYIARRYFYQTGNEHIQRDRLISRRSIRMSGKDVETYCQPGTNVDPQITSSIWREQGLDICTGVARQATLQQRQVRGRLLHRGAHQVHRYDLSDG